MNKHISFTYSDDERLVDYVLQISYEIDPGERRTWDYPGVAAHAEFEWEISEITDWSYDRNCGLTTKFTADEMDADGIVRRWLQRRLDRPSVQADIIGRCLEDAGEREEAAHDEYWESKIGEARGK